MDFVPGIYENVPAHLYHADIWGPTLSRSIAVRLLRDSPLHAWKFHPRLGGQRDEDDSEPRDNGSLLHALLLGGGSIAVIDAPDFRTNKAKDERDQARAAGLTPICAPKLPPAREAARIIADRLASIGVDLAEHQREIVTLWEEDGVKCRSRPDLWHAPTITLRDVKIVRRADPEAFGRSFCANGYDVQHAAYISGIEHLNPQLAGRVKLTFLLCERDPPHDVLEVSPRAPTRSLGRMRWHRAAHRWGECLAADSWPGRSRGKAVGFDVPSWEFQTEMMEGPRQEDPDWMKDGGDTDG